MKLSDFDYHLPKNLIAQKPLIALHGRNQLALHGRNQLALHSRNQLALHSRNQLSRDASRLLVLGRKSGKMKHRRFFEIEKFLHAGDVLVLNNTKVFPARLIGKKETGGKAEILLLKEIKNGIWKVMLKTNNPKIGTKVFFNNSQLFNDRQKVENRYLLGEIINKEENGISEIKFNKSGAEFWKMVNKIGHAPLPPYIKSKEPASPAGGQKNKRTREQKIKEYQTVFAKYLGSVAAPTAGFHFTHRLIARLAKKGVQIEYITLHVGIGTFLPVKTENIKKHKMHAEFAEISKATATRLNQAKKEGRKIVACGTTTCRTLEAVVNNRGQITPLKKEINLFIYPGYKFKFIDALITNFHLPKTTLLMLVCAFASREKILKAYRTAIMEKYRFYSFGDAMLVR